MGYIIVILCVVVLVPLVYILFSKRAGTGPIQGQRPVGKPVQVTEPAADEPTPDASSIQKNTSEAQKRTPAG
jgi:hypothetical protein